MFGQPIPLLLSTSVNMVLSLTYQAKWMIGHFECALSIELDLGYGDLTHQIHSTHMRATPSSVKEMHLPC